FFIVTTKENADERLKTLLAGDARIRSTIHWCGPDNGDLPDLLKDRSSEAVIIIKAETVFNSDIIKEMADPGLDNAIARVAVRNGKVEPGQCTLKLNRDDVVGCSMLRQTDKGHQAGSTEAVTDAQTAGFILTTPDALKDIAMKIANCHIDLSDIVEDLLDAGKVKALDVTNELCMEITSRETMQESRNKLYGLQSKTSDSPFSLYVSRKLSRLVSGVLVRFPISPNQITLLSFFIGLVACWFYLQGGYWYSVIGAMVLFASIILDLSDGEVARLKFMSSRYGGLLDSICDSTVFSGVLFCAALAIYRDSHMPNIIAVGAVAAVVMFICSNLFFYFYSVRKDPENDPSNSIIRTFANEDSFYLALLGFTLFDGLSWYLWAVAAGATVYLFILIKDFMASKPSEGNAQ
ncbi:MAG: CDP-alcohol phosphatidyltransferase family protein, partial [Candidatus Brocadiales bacterium]